MEVFFDKALGANLRSLEDSLAKAAGMNVDLVRNTLRGLVARYREVYAPCFAKANTIIDFMRDTQGDLERAQQAGHTVSMGRGYDIRYGLSIMQHPTRTEEQYAMLNLAARLIQETAELEARSQFLKPHGFSLLAHLTQSSAILIGGKPQKLIPEAIKLYSAYQNGMSVLDAERDALQVLPLTDISYYTYPTFVVDPAHKAPEESFQISWIRKEDIMSMILAE